MATMTMEQQQALEALFRPPAGEAVGRRQMPPVLPKSNEAPGLLQAWLGLSQSDLAARLMSLLADKASLERQILTWSEANPLEAAFELLAASSLAFYLVEKGANPKINSY